MSNIPASPEAAGLLPFARVESSYAILGHSILGLLRSTGYVDHGPEMVQLSRLGEGLNNSSFLVEFASDRPPMVCKIPNSQRMYSGNGVRRLAHEYAVLQQLPEGVAPKPHGVNMGGSAFPILAMEYVDGTVTPYRQWTEASFIDFARKLGKVHRQTQRPPDKPVRLYDAFRRKRTAGWIGMIRRANHPDELLLNDILYEADDYLASVQPLFAASPVISLNHDDLHEGNILVSSDKRTVRLVDWEEAAYGDPVLTDLSNFYYPGYQLRTFRAGLDAKTEALFLEAYASEGSHDPLLWKRLRVGHYMDIARMVISLTGLIVSGEQQAFGMMADELSAEREALLELLRSLERVGP